jgi:hypothetical protein
MTKVNLQAEPSTYQEHLNAIDQAETHNDYSVRQQRMYLDERPFFSKNQIDVAISRATARQFGWVMLAFVIGVFVGVVACHLK